MIKPIHYCNIAQIEGISLNDFRIAFGVIKDMNNPNLEEDLDFIILTSPQHFKALTAIFNQNLEAYEKIFGEIKMEPNVEAISEFGVQEVQVK